MLSAGVPFSQFCSCTIRNCLLIVLTDMRAVYCFCCRFFVNPCLLLKFFKHSKVRIFFTVFLFFTHFRIFTVFLTTIQYCGRKHLGCLYELKDNSRSFPQIDHFICKSCRYSYTSHTK